jgi:hypothetical protein
VLWCGVQESDLDRIISSNQPLTDQHFQYFLYQVHNAWTHYSMESND